MNPVMDLQLEHRSIRKYTGEPIVPELLESLIVAAQAAASSSFIQSYSLVQVNDAGNRSAIATLAGGQAWVEQAAEFLVVCADLHRIDLCCEQQGLGKLEGHTEHFIAATVDAALMAQNLMLAAESEGLGAVFIGGIRNDPQQVCDLLKLPDLVYPVFGLCLGWPDADPDIKPRFPVEMVLHQDSYDVMRRNSDVATYDKDMEGYYGSRGNNQRQSNWSEQTAAAVQKKQRDHMLGFLQSRGFLLR